jgi:hypothetical protein
VSAAVIEDKDDTHDVAVYTQFSIHPHFFPSPRLWHALLPSQHGLYEPPAHFSYPRFYILLGGGCCVALRLLDTLKLFVCGLQVYDGGDFFAAAVLEIQARLLLCSVLLRPRFSGYGCPLVCALVFRRHTERIEL